MTASPITAPLEFAVGIECTFIVDERLNAHPPMRRLEQFELMKHYEMWRQDLDLVAKLNVGDRRVTKLRWCFPWYRMEATRGKFDFSWADAVVDYASQLNIELVPDIVHYGTPSWLEDAFLHPDYTERVAHFASVCAERYKGRIKHYTPLNEPAMTGIFGALRGEWPPYLNSLDGYVKVLVEIALGVQKTTRAIKAIDPQAECWAVEVINSYKALNEKAKPYTKKHFRRDLVYWDLYHGLVNPQHEFYEWLSANGATEAKLEQLMTNPVKMDLLGLNFYPWTTKGLEWKDDQIVEHDDTSDGMTLLELLRDSYAHTGSKLFITETSAHGGGGPRCSSVKQHAPDMRIGWMDETMEAVAAARKEGIPVTGYTQFPLFTMVDWAYRLDNAPPSDYFLNLGMVEVEPSDFSRKWTPVADRFLHHMRTFER